MLEYLLHQIGARAHTTGNRERGRAGDRREGVRKRATPLTSIFRCSHLLTWVDPHPLFHLLPPLPPAHPANLWPILACLVLLIILQEFVSVHAEWHSASASICNARAACNTRCNTRAGRGDTEGISSQKMGGADSGGSSCGGGGVGSSVSQGGGRGVCHGHRHVDMRGVRASISRIARSAPSAGLGFLAFEFGRE